MLTELNGKVAIITGGGRGIGRSIALSLQVNKYNINVNAIRPGATDTRIHSAAPPEKRARMRKPEGIKGVAVFLACQGPLGITGESLEVAAWDNIYLNREAARNAL